MARLPVFRTVLGVDLIGSGSLPAYHRDTASAVMQRIVREALLDRNVPVGTAEVTWQHTGDGALLSFPCEMLADVMDATDRMNRLAAEHTRDHKPDVYLRLSVDFGPLPPHDGLHRPNIDCSRMLDAPAFKAVLGRCQERQPYDFSTGLIVSEAAHRTVFGDDYAELVRERDFGRISFRHKEREATAWIRVPGFDADTLSRLAEDLAESAATEAEEAVAPEATTPTHVSNVAHGPFTGIQAGYISDNAKVRMNTHQPPR